MRRRTRKTNIAISICFTEFYEDLNRYKNKSSNIFVWTEEVRKSSDRLRNQLFGMYLVGAMSWRDFLTLREKAYRISEETIDIIKNNI